MSIQENETHKVRILPLGQNAKTDVAEHHGRIDLIHLLQVVRVRLGVIIGTSLVVIAITTISVFRMTPMYDASSIVILEQRQNKVLDVNAVLSGISDDQTSVENQITILRSRTLWSRVVDKLHLDAAAPTTSDTPSDESTGAGSITNFDFSRMVSDALYYMNPQHWFTPPKLLETDEQIALSRREDIINDLLNGLTVAEIGHSSAMRITFRSPDPKQSATIANALADAYVEDQLNAKFDATQKTSLWLADRIQQLSEQVQAADAAVQQYKADNNITSVQGGGTIVAQQMAQINGQLVNARSALAEAEAKYARVQQLRSAGRINDVSQVVQSGLIGSLVSQETTLMRQQADLSSKYGPRHPKMLELEAEKRNLDQKISQEVQRVVETVTNDVAVSRANVASLQASLKEVEAKRRVESNAEVKLSELTARANSAHQLYDAFLGKFKETQGQENIETPDARVISRAIVPTEPVIPNIPLSLELAVGGGLFLGLLVALLLERLDTGFRTISQIEHFLNLPVLCTLPEISNIGKSQDKTAANLIIDKPLSAYSEAVRGLQMGLVLSNVDRRPKVIVVSSPLPNEGKTTVALSLARVAARSKQNVLLIDGDLRRPSLEYFLPALSKKEKRKGLSDVLAGEISIDQCLVDDPRSSVKILPTPRIIGNPPDLLGSSAMDHLIQSCRAKFDLIVIDSAPLLIVNDTKVLAQLADAVLLVVRWEKTTREAVMHAARSLVDVGAHIAGIVLTRAHAKRYRNYTYGYQRDYQYTKYYN